MSAHVATMAVRLADSVSHSLRTHTQVRESLSEGSHLEIGDRRKEGRKEGRSSLVTLKSKRPVSDARVVAPSPLTPRDVLDLEHPC